MPTNQPFQTTADGMRRFACSAVAVQGVIFNAEERVLLLSSPTKNRPDEWQTVSGSLEAAETVLAGVLREVHEEAGPYLQVRPLGVVHVQTFHFDAHVPYVIGIYYLLAYDGGVVQSGDDMAGARHRWWSLEELCATTVRLHPSTQLWMLQRALVLYRIWHDQPPVPLQPTLDPS